MKVLNKVEITNKLETISQDSTRTPLVKEVTNIILDHIEDYNDPGRFFFELFTYKCVSGLITDLIYYEDTYKFFDRHSEEIIMLLNKDKLDIKWFSKNDLSWFAFEQVASDLYQEVVYDRQ